MTENARDFGTQDVGGEAERTLRLLAQLPAPEGLTERVHGRLGRERASGTRRGFWRLWLPAHRLQFAGAAALVLAVAGSTLSLRYKQTPAAHGTTPGASAPAPALSRPEAAADGAFGTASASRRPATLTPIPAPAPPRKKPGASRAAVRHAAKTKSAGEQSEGGTGSAAAPQVP